MVGEEEEAQRAGEEREEGGGQRGLAPEQQQTGEAGGEGEEGAEKLQALGGEEAVEFDDVVDGAPEGRHLVLKQPAVPGEHTVNDVEEGLDGGEILGEMEQEGEEQESEGEDNRGSDSHEMERALDEALAQQPDKEDQRVVESNLLVSDGHDEEEGAHAVPVQRNARDCEEDEAQADRVVLEVGVVDEHERRHKEHQQEALRFITPFTRTLLCFS